MRRTSSIILTLTALSAALPLIAMGPIKREANDSRDALTAIEARPLDRSILADLTDWTHADVLSADNIQGRFVLLAVLSASDPQSVMMLSQLSRMQRDFNDQGILVAIIHPEFGFEQMTEFINNGRVTLPVAKDTNSTFATAMHTDDYPDLYLIDRAGNLRFADLDKRSLKDALTLLASETPQTAAANAVLQAMGLAPQTPQAPATDPAVGTDVTTKSPDAPKPTYTSGNWPPYNKASLSAKNIQGQHLPIELGNEEWITEERNHENKVLILDFWDTAGSSTVKVTRIYNKLMEQHEGKLEILGIAGPEDRAKVDRFLKNFERNYPQLYDANETLAKELGITARPLAYILSTDGVVRWQGFPLESSFIDAVEQSIAADPKVDN